MKKSLILILLLIVLQSFDSRTKWKVYQNDYYIIEYPRNWNKLETPSSMVFLPGEIKVGYVKESFSVYIDTLIGYDNLSDYYSFLLEQTKKSSNNIIKSEIINTEKEVYYLLSYEGVELEWMNDSKYIEKVKIANKKAYRMVFFSEKKKFNKYLPIIDHMMESFKIKDTIKKTEN